MPFHAANAPPGVVPASVRYGLTSVHAIAENSE
ncbi:hypothetical protein Asd1617_04145 [Shigella dysenteriae 1617]|uniref:Uncharacterized protein n=1 Tax=Shigella dysenteriae 1617 TaxID=754093 RepID=A0A0A6ZYF7_SHIDY|nr:hypothetical protein Asd1617_04145 [Shigella dysenteriae 1617]